MARRMLEQSLTQCLYQLHATLEGESSVQQCFEAALRWLRGKFRDSQIPADVRLLPLFELSHAGHRLTTRSLPEGSEFSFSYVHPDSHSSSGFWWVEFAYNESSMGVRLLFRDYKLVSRKPPANRINLVLDLAQMLTLTDVWPIDVEPYHIDSRERATDLLRLLESKRRFLPVVLITEKRQGTSDGIFWPLDPGSVAEKLAGIAHVATMPQAATAIWTGLVGKDWSAFHGAVRVYMPELDFRMDGLAAHPLTLCEWVEASEQGFLEGLRSRLLQFSGSRAVDWQGLLFQEELSFLSKTSGSKIENTRTEADLDPTAGHVDSGDDPEEPPTDFRKALALLQDEPRASKPICVKSALTSCIRRWVPDASEAWGIFLHLGLLACPISITNSVLGAKGYAETFQTH